MKMGRGVEWAVHSCVNMAWTPAGEAVNSARLAEYYRLPGAYLGKQLQALVRAGVLASEGQEPAFRCDAILGNVPEPDSQENYARTCLISQTMRQAELVWRQALARQTIAGIAESMERRFPQDKLKALDFLAAQ
jgi:DNA-binding IscR family transcriptional regulator